VNKTNWALRISDGPIKVGCRITFTFGGVWMSEKDIFPGLFEMVGGLFYENYPGLTAEVPYLAEKPAVLCDVTLVLPK